MKGKVLTNMDGNRGNNAVLTSDGQFVEIILYNAEGQEISLDEVSLKNFGIKYFSDMALQGLVCEDLAQFITMIILLFLCFPICQIVILNQTGKYCLIISVKLRLLRN